MATTATERKLFVAGEWVETGEWIDVRSPYSGDVVGRVAKGGADETAARSTPPSARSTTRCRRTSAPRSSSGSPATSAVGTRRWRATISDEAGKPIKAARVEAARAMSTYTYAAVAARTLAGEVIPMEGSQAGEGKLGFTIRVPIGIVGAISPFNFPLNLVAHKLAPALAAGCPVVLKPATQTPLSALLLAELEEEAGLPPGWLSVIVGPASEIGDVLVEDERVKLITFTGSGRRRLGHPRARAAQEGQPRARQLDARDRRCERRPRRRARRRSPRTGTRTPGRAASRSSASTSSVPRYDDVPRSSSRPRSRRSTSATPPTTTPTSGR